MMVVGGFVGGMHVELEPVVKMVQWQCLVWEGIQFGPINGTETSHICDE